MMFLQFILVMGEDSFVTEELAYKNRQIFHLLLCTAEKYHLRNRSRTRSSQSKQCLLVCQLFFRSFSLPYTGKCVIRPLYQSYMQHACVSPFHSFMISYWSLSKVNFWLGFADCIFRCRKATGGKYVCFHRLLKNPLDQTWTLSR